MNLISSHKPVKVNLMMSSRIYAEKFCRQQSDPQKAKQVYLNSLAVSAVRIYLNSLGWSTNLEQSDSWNPTMQTLMDIADLEIPGFGKIECRTALLDQQELIVPPEVQSDRAAYIIVKFSSSLQECELLGFTPAITANSISLKQLQPIGNLTAHLREFKQLQERKKSQPMIELSKWGQGVIDDGWELLATIFQTEPSLAFRSPALAKISNQNPDQLSQGISRVKLLNFGNNLNTIPIALILQLVTNDSEEMDISARICPTNTNVYLPQGLQIMILDEMKKPVLQAETNQVNEKIEFLFSGKSGEIFSIEASLQDRKIVETFII
ncbi:MAG: DUF1822 family protein [Cyanobacteria bacterium P01_F01_bin.143]